MRIRSILFGSFLALLPVFAFAQPAPTTHVEVTIFREGATAPAVAPALIPISAWVGNQPIVDPPAGTVVNPNQLRVEDPANNNRDLVYVDPPTGILSLLGFDPVNVYYATVKFINQVGAGPTSNNSNFFSRPGTIPTVTPARLRWVRGQ